MNNYPMHWQEVVEPELTYLGRSTRIDYRMNTRPQIIYIETDKLEGGSFRALDGQHFFNKKGDPVVYHTGEKLTTRQILRLIK